VPQNELKQKIVSELTRARYHLDSYKKVIKLKFDQAFKEEHLEVLESFSSRFARFSDIAITKYFKLLIAEKDPAFRGSVADLLNNAEKYHWIDSAHTWLRIRELRNIAAHEYSAEEYPKIYQELIHMAPTLFQLSLTL
jgi:hypothetical protein